MTVYKRFIYLALIAFFAIGGCDIDFGNDDDNGTDNDNETTRVRGEIVRVYSREDNDDVDRIRVVIKNSTQTTGENGIFDIRGNISGDNGDNEEIQFQDANDENSVIGRREIDIFPGAELNLGEIEIEDGFVDILEDIFIDFSGDIIDNNCSNNKGSIRVEIEDSDTEVLVLIDSSTNVDRDDEGTDCEDITEGEELEIEGTCSGVDCSNVQASQIDF